MTPIVSRMVSLAFGSCLVTAFGLAGCVSDAPEKGGIHFSQPVLGARDAYVRFHYGGPKSPETTKTYTQDSMSLEVVEVRDNSMTLIQKWCYAQDTACTTLILTVDRTTGHVEAREGEGRSELETVNSFPSGIFTDSARTIEFTDYTPKVESPAVGKAPEYHLAGKTYRQVTVMVDPTGVPMDRGGQVLILSQEKRLIELYSYHVFGTDGGWELRE